MASIWLAALLLGSGVAVSIGSGVKRKSDQRGHHSRVHGYGGGCRFAIGQGRGNLGMVPNATMPFAVIFGASGAMVCVAKDTSQMKG